MRRYLHALNQQWPLWVSLLNTGFDQADFLMCLVSAIAVAPGKAFFPLERLDDAMGGFGALNHLFDHYGFPESESENISSDLQAMAD
ncbi:MAG: hypothetical protein V7772_06090 [Pseudomonas profundi]|uniref:hypothetical protein n=1 Tax=Pseudomonas profundi TaxID=1981513 RepID=UPI003002A375